MNVEDIRTLYAYNQWANRRVLAKRQASCGRRFRSQAGASHGSVRGTLIHILGGEWLQR